NHKSGYGKYKSCLKFEIGDMRHITHRNEFDLVINIFTSFGYFEKDSDNEKVIKVVSRALKPGGWFLIDFLNRNYLARSIVPFDIKKEHKKIIVQLRTISSRYVEKNVLIFRNNRNLEAYPVLNRFKEKIRLYSNDDFMRMFKRAGLKPIKVFGSYYGTKYNRNNSERLIILAQKI
ncbi:MAG TPA: class I SAM-dependent methyltransferase, partial [Flavobacterium sp.]